MFQKRVSRNSFCCPFTGIEIILQGMPQTMWYLLITACIYLTMNQTILEIRQPKTSKILVERTPTKENTKLYPTEITWEDLRGLF